MPTINADLLISNLLGEAKGMWKMSGERQYGINLTDAGPSEKCPECKKEVLLSRPRRGSGESQPNSCNKCKAEIFVVDDY